MIISMMMPRQSGLSQSVNTTATGRVNAGDIYIGGNFIGDGPIAISANIRSSSNRVEGPGYANYNIPSEARLPILPLLASP